MAGLLQVRPAHPKSVQCAISHPYAWKRLTLGRFGPFQAPIQGPRGPKIVFYVFKLRPLWRAVSRERHLTWKGGGGSPLTDKIRKVVFEVLPYWTAPYSPQ